MSETLSLLNAVGPVFGLALAGFWMRKRNWLTADADVSVLRITVNFLMPCLIINASINNPALRDFRNLLLAPLVGFVTASGGMLLAYSIRGWLRTRTTAEARIFGVSVGLYNYGFIPIPLAMLMFGSETVGVLCLHNVGVELAVWTTAVWMMSGARLAGIWSNVLNAPLAAIVVGLMLNWTGLENHLPEPLLIAVRWSAECAIPMSLILAGALIADHLGEFHARHGRTVIGWALVLRLGILPVCFLGIAKLLPASTELKRVIVIQAAMTSAVFPIALARLYGGDPATAVRVTLATSVVGILTIPLWIHFGLKLLAL